MSDLESTRLDKSAFDVIPLEAANDKAYWLSRSPYERLRAAELLRQVTYGYDPATARLQRVPMVALETD
jgi:hypothetical protein